MSRKARVLTSIPGIAQVTAAGLLSEMPELGRIDAKAAASLAPVTRESGEWKGRSFIRGGRARPRRMLYMAAVSAVRHNPDLARKYAELRARGKPSKVALTAIMRKMVVLANALLKQDRLWTPSPATATGLSRCPRCSCGGLRPRRRERQRPQPRPKAAAVHRRHRRLHAVMASQCRCRTPRPQPTSTQGPLSKTG